MKSRILLVYCHEPSMVTIAGGGFALQMACINSWYITMTCIEADIVKSEICPSQVTRQHWNKIEDMKTSAQLTKN